MQTLPKSKFTFLGFFGQNIFEKSQYYLGCYFLQPKTIPSHQSHTITAVQSLNMLVEYLVEQWFLCSKIAGILLFFRLKNKVLFSENFGGTLLPHSSVKIIVEREERPLLSSNTSGDKFPIADNSQHATVVFCRNILKKLFFSLLK